MKINRLYRLRARHRYPSIGDLFYGKKQKLDIVVSKISNPDAPVTGKGQHRGSIARQHWEAAPRQHEIDVSHSPLFMAEHR